jgi:chorismate lyase / 3-hydroxybenzoate synthase
VGFDQPPSIDRARIPVTASMTRALRAGDLCEVWRVAGPHSPLSSAESAQARIQYRYSEDLLFGSLTIAEQAVEANGEAGALLRATEIAYQEIFDVLNETDHRHLIRIWNYLPDINAQAGGDERYRHFNSARQTAFRKSGRATMGTVPAASALGSPSGSPISIYFLAARRPPKMIENPRQTSAYHYPPQFGRHSPIFSRACVWGESARLFVSGTASIVGHETIHRGDVVAQTRETLVNISALLDEANRVVGAARYSLDELKLKVYVRKPTDLPAIEATLSQLLRPASGIVYLQADVCREDLLVEIEAVG